MYEKIIGEIVGKFLRNESISNDLNKFYGNNVFACELFDLADRCVLNSFKANITYERKAQVIVALTYLALSEYDGGLWEQIREKFIKSYECRGNPQFVDGKIRNIVSNFKNYVDYYHTESIVAVPIILAGVTHHWLPSFFDYCFLIYKNRLLANSQITDEQLEKQLFYTFSSLQKSDKLNVNEDIIRFGEGHAYQLSKFTQSALKSGKNIDGLAKIGAYCIRLVINELTGEQMDIKPFFKESFENWKKHFYRSKKEQEDIVKKSKEGIWRSSFIYEYGKIFVQTKTRWISDNYDPFKIELVVLNGNQLLHRTDDLLIEDDEMGAMIIKSKKVEMSEGILGQLHYQIKHGEEIIYDSGEELHRDALIFNQYGGEIHRGKDFDGTAILVSRTLPSNYVNIVEYLNDGYITQINIDSSEDYIFDNKHYSFKSINKPSIEGEDLTWILVKSKIFNLYYKIYKNIKNLYFSSVLKSEQIMVKQNGIFTNELSLIKMYSQSNGVNFYKIKGDKIKNGFNKIDICSKDGKDIENFTFILDEDIERVIDVENQLIEVLFLGKKERHKIDSNKDYLNFLVNIDRIGPCNLLIEQGISWISFDGINWLDSCSRIDIEKIDYSNAKLFVKANQIKKIITKTDLGNILEPQFKIIDEFGWKYEVSVMYLLNYKNSNVKTCSVDLIFQNHIDNYYIDYVTFIDLSKTILNYNQKDKCTHFMFCSDENKIFNVEIIGKGNDVIKFNLESNKQYFIKKLKSFIEYKIYIKEKRGFSKEKNIAQFDYFFCDKDDLCGKIFKIEEVEILGSKSNYKKKLFGAPITLKFSYKDDNDVDLFHGNLQQIMTSYNYKKYNAFSNLGKLFIRVEDEFENDKLWVYLYDKDEEQLLYDRRLNTVCSTTEINNTTKNMEGIERFLISPFNIGGK